MPDHYKKKGGLVSRIVEYHMKAKKKQAEEERKKRTKRNAVRSEGKRRRK